MTSSFDILSHNQDNEKKRGARRSRKKREGVGSHHGDNLPEEAGGCHGQFDEEDEGPAVG